MKIKTMRDIPTRQSRTGRTGRADRRNIAAEISRLEHARANLEREIDTWQHNLSRAESRLHDVETQMAHLRQQLARLAGDDVNQAPPPPSTAPRPSRRAAPAADWHEVSIEY
jgi:outer membrane protein TolC